MKDYNKSARGEFINNYYYSCNQFLGFRSEWEKVIVALIFIGLSLIGIM